MDDFEHRLQTITSNQLEKLGIKLYSLEEKLQANSLPATLKRGFSYLSDEEGNLVRTVEKLSPGKKVRVHLEDGNRMLEALGDESG